ncbi:aldehyde dehydrogenase family protein, partial [Staphylococcus pasteuri]|uniref:aldehyde dehydrogenase family protein n=1 Tax=Staphylococcus pasteuri TaxID=45972 RepID=UPI0012B93A1E
KVKCKMECLSVGDRVAEKRDLGGIINESELNRIEEKVEDDVNNGGKLVLGGEKLEGGGYLYGGSVLDNVKETDSVFKEEILGGVLGMRRYNEFNEVIEEGNDRKGGVSCYIL